MIDRFGGCGLGKDKYDLFDLLGEGAHGEVHRARQKATNRQVAVKRLAGSDDPEAFLREIEILARFHHSNIVQIYEAGYWDDAGELYIAMQLVEGGTLAAKLAHEGLRDPLVSARLVAKLARTVHFAHEHNVLHLDLKPQNILLDPRGVPFVADFDIAQLLGEVRAPHLAGTLPYMAPEQCNGVRPRVWTDVYALGTLLYQLATGETPYPLATTIEQRRSVFESGTRPPAASQVAAKHHWALGRRLDLDFDRICEGALAIDPTERYASADALADDLDRWVLGLPLFGPKRMPPPIGQRILRFTRRNLSALSLSVLWLLLSLVCGLIVTWTTEKYLQDWILKTDRLVVELQAQILQGGIREFKGLVAKLADSDTVRQALEQPGNSRCDPAAGPELTETAEWRNAMSQGIWKDGPDQAYVSDTQGCFYKYWPAPGPRSVYTHWYGFRDYFSCAYQLGMAHSKETCIARVFRSEYDWYQNTLRMALATPVYDKNDNWIGVFVASWRVERPLADVALGPMPALESKTALLVPRDLERGSADEQLRTYAKQHDITIPRCDCDPKSAPTAPTDPGRFVNALQRPASLLIVPRSATREEKAISADASEAIADALRSGTLTLDHFKDPRDNKEYLAAFAPLQDVPKNGAKNLTAADAAPLLMVATERAVLTGYTWGLYCVGVFLWFAGLGLLLRFFSVLARSDQEKLLRLKGNNP
jgi:serine/threonine protein kinase